MGKQESSVRFITSDGNRVGDEDTAETVSLRFLRLGQSERACLMKFPSMQLGLEDQDEIDAMVEQLGGSA